MHPDLAEELRKIFPAPEPSLDLNIRNYDYYAGVNAVLKFIEAELQRKLRSRVSHQTARPS